MVSIQFENSLLLFYSDVYCFKTECGFWSYFSKHLTRFYYVNSDNVNIGSKIIIVVRVVSNTRSLTEYTFTLTFRIRLEFARVSVDNTCTMHT